MAERETGRLSTEEKIKEAAKKVFITKGYAATKTRDVAEEAGINIASLHYYYRSKDRLFEIVVKEAFLGFVSYMDKVFNSDISLKEKITAFVSFYTEFLKENPYIPMFLFTEIQRNPEKIFSLLKKEQFSQILKKDIEQVRPVNQKGRQIDHTHFLANLLGLTVFPFLAKPVLMMKTGIDEQEFEQLLEERKTMVPEIIMGIIKS